jgi:glycogen synthase
VNEVICHSRSGLLIRSIPSGSLSNGLTIYDPDPGHLRECIEELADPDRLASFFSSTRAEAMRDRFNWDHTRSDYLAVASGEALPPSALA